MFVKQICSTFITKIYQLLLISIGTNDIKLKLPDFQQFKLVTDSDVSIFLIDESCFSSCVTIDLPLSSQEFQQMT